MKEKRNTGIYIKTEKVVKYGGIRGYLTKKIDALEKDKLPEEYLNSGNHCYKQDKNTILINLGGFIYFIRKDEFYESDYFNNLISALDVCGERLKFINDKIKKEWNGKATFRI